MRAPPKSTENLLRILTGRLGFDRKTLVEMINVEIRCGTWDLDRAWKTTLDHCDYVE